MERHHESAYRCYRVGHADCEPDVRSELPERATGADQRVSGEPEFRGQRLLRADTTSVRAKDFRFKAHVTACFDNAAGACAGRLTKVQTGRRSRCSRKYALHRLPRRRCWHRLRSPPGHWIEARRPSRSAISASYEKSWSMVR